MKKTILRNAVMLAAIIGIALITALSLPEYSASAQSKDPEPAMEQQTGDDSKTESVRPRKGNPLMSVLDADKDGALSADEIENAGIALKSLDKNGDGKLTRDEMPRKKGTQVKGN